MANLTKAQWYRVLSLMLAEHHKRHCDGAACNISLHSIREMAEAAGANFTAADADEFI